MLLLGGDYRGLQMQNVTFNYGKTTAKENLAVAHNAWLSDVERAAIKHMVENGTEAQCKEFKDAIEKKLTDRVNASLSWY